MAHNSWLQTRFSTISAALDALMEDWLGYSLPPPARAMAEAKWTPDARGAYCHRCGDSVGAGEATETGCGRCRGKPALGDEVVRLGAHEGELRRWVNRVKYNRWWPMGWHLGEELGETVRRSTTVDASRAIVVPMPMPWQRRLYRGIDHARLFADGAARVLHAPVVPMLRKRNDRPQSTRTPTDRLRYGGKGMALRRRLGGWNLTGLHVVLIDDVRTTSGSLRAAVRLIRACKPERIICATITVSDDKARRSRSQQARVQENKAGRHAMGDKEEENHAAKSARLTKKNESIFDDSGGRG